MTVKVGNQKNALPNWLRAGFGVLVFLTVMATIKTLFFGLDRDEAYAVTVAYRLVQGDRLFLEMWEPHQTSAILSAVFIKLFLSIFHTTTGIVIYLKCLSILITGIIAYCLYVVMKKYINKNYCILGALLYYNMSPKEVTVPEFSWNQVWAVTLLILCLIQYYDQVNQNRKRLGWIVGAGLCMCWAALSYPSLILIFPIIFIKLIWDRKGYKPPLFFFLTCLFGAVIFSGYILLNMSPSELIYSVKEIIASDSYHGAEQNGIGSSSGNLLVQTLIVAVCYAIGIAACYLYNKFLNKKDIHKDIKTIWRILFYFLLVAASVQIVIFLLPTKMFWLSTFLYYFVIMAVGIIILCRKRAESYLWPCIVCCVMSFICTILLSNLTIFDSAKYMMSGIAIIAIVLAEKIAEKYEDFAKGYIVLMFLCITAVSYRGYSLNSSDIDKTTVLDVRGIIKEGPAIFTLTDYMTAYIQNTTFGEFRHYIQPGDNLLIASDGTLDYMDIEGINICVSSTISTPTYDEHLLHYWKQNPDKYPNVVVIDCWYGETRYPKGTWLGNWLENDFRADELIDEIVNGRGEGKRVENKEKHSYVV